MAAQAKGAASELQGVAAPGSSSPEFVGRDDSLSAVVNTLRDGPALVIVEGEPGIGKSRLLREALAALPDRTVLLAACPPLREPFPLGAIVDGVRRLRPAVGQLGLSPLGGALRPLFPEWTEALPAALEGLDDPKETRHRLFSALTELVERLGVDILVVEDLHWADAASLEWLLTLTAADSAPWSIVATCRPTDVSEGSLLPRLTSRVPAEMNRLRIELEPLDVTQAGRLVASMLGTDAVSEQFAEFLHDRTDGVPLALEETVRLLRDRHDIVRQHGSWTRRVLEELDVPPTLRDSVLERVDRLDPSARMILQAAAIIAEPSDQPLLAAVADLDEQAARQGIAHALAAGLLREADGGRLAFRHVLDAHAVEEAIPASERWQLHHRAAKALQQLDPQPVARLARHFREANDTEQWCHYAEAAADLALESGDDNTTVEMLHEVLTTIAHPGVRRARLARKLGETAARGTSALGDRAVHLAETLRDVLADPGTIPVGERGELRLLLGRLLRWSGQMEAAYEEFEAAIPDMVNQPAMACRAMMLLGMPLVPDRPAEWHLRWVELATAQLPRVESRTQRLSLLQNRATALLLLGEEAGWEAANQIPESAPTEYERRVIAAAMSNIGQLAIVWGRYGEARSRLDVAIELMQATKYERVMNVARVARAHLDWCTGAWEGLTKTAAELATILEVEPTPARLDARSVEGLLELAGGSLRAAERCLRGVVDEFAGRGLVGPEVGLPAAGLGRLYLAEDAPRKALEVTEPVMVVIGRKQVWLWARDLAQVHLDALIATGELEQAEALVEQFADGLAGRDAPAPAAALVLCRGILADTKGDLGNAADLFAEAAAAWATLPRPYDELLALERQGRCLLAADEEGKGLEVLSDAQQRLQELGARWDADRVAHVLRKHGVEVARTWRQGRRGYGDELSPRELQVVELVAQGMTNKQIAEALFISTQTVSRHMYSSMRKLSVSSRTALAMAASEAGLLSGG